MHDDAVKAMLAQTALTNEPRLQHSTEKIFARARRTQNRQRIQTGLAAVVALSVISGVVLSWSRGGQSSPAVTGAPPTASPSPTPSSAPLGLTDGEAMLSNLIRLLPVGETAGQPWKQEGYAEVVAVDSEGRTKFKINVQPLTGSGPHPPITPDMYDCTKRFLPSGSTCSSETLVDGTLLVITNGPVDDPPPPAGVVTRVVDTLRPGQLRVVVAEVNAIHEKTGPSTRRSPALTAEQLKALVLDPSWLG
jgi:hypothetical protein